MASPELTPSSDDHASPRINPGSESNTSEAPANQVEPSTLDDENEKISRITDACQSHDLQALVTLTETTGGLLNDELRKEAWPLLLGCDNLGSSKLKSASWTDLPPHRDEDQVELDVNRAFVYYPKDLSESDLDNRKKALSNLIRGTLRMHPMLSYFQGYHDIVQVMLLVLGESTATVPIARLSLLRIRDYMLHSMTPAVKHLQLLPALLDKADPELCKHLAHTKPYFALAATLTLYAHDIQDYSNITRLYDFLLAHEPVIAIYMFGAVIISRKKELMEIGQEEPEMLHFTLTKLPSSLDVEGLISLTLSLFQKYPPDGLPYGAWRRISSYSVLKTSRDLANNQSLETGEELFRKQAQELKREEMQKRIATTLWKHRRPASRVFIAVLMGAFSLWLGRSGNSDKIISYFWKFKTWISSAI